MSEELSKKRIRSFTDLIVWQNGHQLIIQLYQIVKNFPEFERYGLISQIQRASVSVTCNIAEGFGRKTPKDRLHFFYQSQGSLIEVKNLLLISRDVGCLKTKDFDNLANLANDTHKLLQGLITRTKTNLTHNS